MTIRLMAITAFSLALALPSGARAQQDTVPSAEQPQPTHLTTSGYAACFARNDFHHMMTLIAEGDTLAYRALLEDRKACFPLKGGIRVVVMEGYGTFVEVLPVALRRTIWTVPEALERVGQAESER